MSKPVMVVTESGRVGVAHVDDVTNLGPCNAPATLAGTDGSITIARCWRPKGHEGTHDGPLERASWGG